MNQLLKHLLELFGNKKQLELLQATIESICTEVVATEVTRSQIKKKNHAESWLLAIGLCLPPTKTKQLANKKR